MKCITEEQLKCIIQEQLRWIVQVQLKCLIRFQNNTLAVIVRMWSKKTQWNIQIKKSTHKTIQLNS